MENTTLIDSPVLTSQRQAAWVVRSHVLLIALGLARIYHYPFQDEGTDPTQITHHAGFQRTMEPSN
jgi:hypothetical protein